MAKPTGNQILAFSLLLASFLPIWRSGGRTGLTFWGWVINHTIFGKPVEYVPFESYSRELEGTRLDENGNLVYQWGTEYATRESAVKELVPWQEKDKSLISLRMLTTQ